MRVSPRHPSVRRGGWPILLVLLMVGTGITGSASQTAKPAKIAILTTAMSPWHTETEGFRDGLRDFGYSEDKSNVTFVVRAAGGDPVRAQGLAEDLAQEKPDLLYCVSSTAARACHRATASAWRRAWLTRART